MSKQKEARQTDYEHKEEHGDDEDEQQYAMGPEDIDVDAVLMRHAQEQRAGCASGLPVLYAVQAWGRHALDALNPGHVMASLCDLRYYELVLSW